MNKKISELASLNNTKNTDLLAIVDVTPNPDSANITKKITVGELLGRTTFSEALIKGPFLTNQISTSTIPSSIDKFITFGFNEIDSKAETWWKTVATPTTIRPWHYQSLDGRWWQMNNHTWTPQMFGAKADSLGRGNGTDNTTALGHFFDACSILGGEGFIPSGTYRVSGQLLWDVGKNFQSSAALFPTIRGAGEGVTTLIFDTSVASPCFQITNKTGFNNGQRAVFYGEVKGFSIETNCSNGIGVLIGDGDLIGAAGTTVYFNGTKIGPLNIANRAQTTDSIGILTSGLITCWVYIVSNCGGVPSSHGGGSADFYGIAHQIQACSMTAFYGAFGNAKIGTYIKGPWTCLGNTWYNVDWEVLETCFKSDTPYLSGNGTCNITGGVMTMCDYAFDITTGQGLVMEGIAIGDVRYSIIKNVESNTVGQYGGFGLILERDNQNFIGKVRSGNYWDARPGGPGPGSPLPVQPTLTLNQWIKNRWGQRSTVYIYASQDDTSIEIFKRDWFDFTSAVGRRVALGPFRTIPIRLEAGESIRITSSSLTTPTWYWEPIY